jgi:hypothetical protein
MKRRLISEQAGLTAVLAALVLSIGLSGASIWTSAGPSRAIALAAPSAHMALAPDLVRVKLPGQPQWQQRFFDFDRSNARLAKRLVLGAALQTI